MRLVLVLLVACLWGCDAAPPGVMLAVDAASVVVFGRGLADLGVSAATGRDCSVVRLDRGQTYCATSDVPRAQTYCTRTLATVDCWASPDLLPVARQGVGDTPPPTLAQEKYRAAPWPKSLRAPP